MKKLLILLLALLTLSGCAEIGKQDVDPNKRYFAIIETIKERDAYNSSSNYFDINVEMASIDGGYRYYVTIDNPRAALYDVEAIAIETDVDYTNNMAANVGIFEDKEYSMIPNQKNPDKGYVSGLVISGVSEKPETTLYIYVSFKSEDYSNTHTEYFKLNAKLKEE